MNPGLFLLACVLFVLVLLGVGLLIKAVCGGRWWK